MRLFFCISMALVAVLLMCTQNAAIPVYLPKHMALWKEGVLNRTFAPNDQGKIRALSLAGFTFDDCGKKYRQDELVDRILESIKSGDDYGFKLKNWERKRWGSSCIITVIKNGHPLYVVEAEMDPVLELFESAKRLDCPAKRMS
ncbi:hypothetical protein CAEBREN_05416 [Caenorhabditis brenneri]|uniref:NTF2-like domain-containing protein n=1 Tax=Caenorhabditis brenneri TaxID=135651 RepID=G0NFG0_CAEBE|nr:hypothetical protein CAEBREN_05416 [Caenorhabditis brenneri]